MLPLNELACTGVHENLSVHSFYFSRCKDVLFVFSAMTLVCHCFLSPCWFHLNSLTESRCALHYLRVRPGRNGSQVWLFSSQSWITILNILRSRLWTTSPKPIPKPNTVTQILTSRPQFRTEHCLAFSDCYLRWQPQIIKAELQFGLRPSHSAIYLPLSRFSS